MELQLKYVDVVTASPLRFRLSACRLACQEIEPKVSTVRLQSHNSNNYIWKKNLEI